ncbi:glycosyltransferase [Nodosilinea sp. LEGE 06152]|uniref:glycosyltransferase family 4 protein n=1 Tax=Nodosilinea sp. LEGE 06152 TaxID=2777966 RepID=UPI0018800BFC|nr:glycosyltransferase [Nodosilinea sp. LEGE 06152]MBE9160006.1 glycosyltransferase [Nodosilinea sp. LEGE 06152]
MRLLIVNFAGDIRTDFHRLNSGGAETYYAQKYSIESYARLRQYAEEVADLIYLTEEAYDEVLPNGVRAIGCGFRQFEDIDPKKIIQLIENYDPTHLVLLTVDKNVLDWAVKRKIPTITTFANAISMQSSTPLHSLLRRIKNHRIVSLLNQPNIEWVGSYGINSSKKLQKLGVKPEKIVPWDFLIDANPGGFSPKILSKSKQDWSLCYIGSISEDKGVGDLLKAVKQLRSRSISVRLGLVGSDSTNFAKDMIAKLGLEDSVELLGFVPNHEVEPLMNSMDLVIVPSRHNYPEGFPLVIHHALRACTPIVASNHPMFKGYLQHQVNAMIFPEANASALANCVEEVLTNTDTYRRISEVSHATWHQLRLPVKWADLVSRWVSQSPADHQWLADHSLNGSKQKTTEQVSLHADYA